MVGNSIPSSPVISKTAQSYSLSLPLTTLQSLPNSSQMPPKLISGPKRRTNPLIWLAAIICTILSVAVIITGITVFIGYVAIHPRVPFISVSGAHLNRFQNDITGLLEVELTIVIEAENDNGKAHASFSETSFLISFEGIEMAKLMADPFEVNKNSSQELSYLVQSSAIPLNSEQMERVDWSLKENVIRFDLKGSSRARWRVGLLGSVKFWCHLNCQLKFHPLNGTYISSPCTSRPK